MLKRIVVGALAVLAATASPVGAQDAKPDVKVKLEGHRAGVGAVAFAPSGEVIVTGSGNGVVRLWDVKTGEVQTKLDPVGGTKVVHAGFSADGAIVSVAARKSVVAWSLSEPRKPKPLFEDTSREASYKVGGVSGDGRRVYHVDPDNSSLRYYAVKDEITRSTDFRLNQVTPLAFAAAPDADSSLAVVLSLGGDGKSPLLTFVGLGDTWQLTDGLKAPDVNPNSVAFSPDGKWLVVCCGGEAQVWKVPGSQKVAGKPRAVGTGGVAAAGPNNVLAVAEKVEGKVRVHLIDLAAELPKAFATFATEIEDVSCLAFAPDGKTLAVGDNVEGVVQLWALPARK